MRTMGAAEQRPFLETADPRALGVAERAFQRWPGRERDDAIAEWVATVWAMRVFNLESAKDSVALIGPSIDRAILRVRYGRRIAGWARGFDVFDDRADRKRQQLQIIGSDRRVARFGRTTRTHLRGCLWPYAG
jgi:hypothetical protein